LRLRVILIIRSKPQFVLESIFFLNQQFITRRAEADRGSYFRNYIQKTHSNMKLQEKREKEKDKGTNRQVERRKGLFR